MHKNSQKCQFGPDIRKIRYGQLQTSKTISLLQNIVDTTEFIFRSYCEDFRELKTWRPRGLARRPLQGHAYVRMDLYCERFVELMDRYILLVRCRGIDAAFF